MTETTEQDPSIEEILASIRQIISDDDEVEDAENDAKVDVAEEEPVQEDDTEDDLDDNSDDVFELTKDMEESSVTADEGLGIKFQDQLEDESYDLGDDLDSGFSDIDNGQDREIFTETAASVTVDGFKKLSEKVALSSYSDNITLEEIVKDMLRPMLREWIDGNMPQLVEVLVEKELEKLARHAKDS